MKVTQLLSVLPLVNSIYTQTDQDCSNNPYQILDDTEFKNLRAELKNNIPSASNDKTLNSRVLSSAKFYKRLPQASWLETNGNSPPMALLSPADQASKFHYEGNKRGLTFGKSKRKIDDGQEILMRRDPFPKE